MDEVDEILFYLSEGDLSKLNIVRRMNPIDAYKFIYQKRLESLNNKKRILKELENGKRK